MADLVRADAEEGAKLYRKSRAKMNKDREAGLDTTKRKSPLDKLPETGDIEDRRDETEREAAIASAKQYGLKLSKRGTPQLGGGDLED